MKVNLNKLSYTAYGNLVITILILFSIVFTIFPFPLCMKAINYLLRFLIFVSMIPIYLVSRAKYGHELHLIGLNKCFIFTTAFYFILDLLIYIVINYYGMLIGFILGTIVTLLATYFTSALTNIHEDKGKLFWGFKPRNAPSKYADVEEYVKGNEFNKKLIKYEEKLKEKDNRIYMIYKYRFKDGLSFKIIAEKLDTDTKRVSDELEKIAFSIRMMKDI